MTATDASSFRAARDFLLRHREDYDTAYREFRWPKLERFNWALDHFDAIARGNRQPALWLVNEGSGEVKVSFAELAERTDRVANHLRRLSVRRGDRMLLMLGKVQARVVRHLEDGVAAEFTRLQHPDFLEESVCGK